MVTFAFCTIWSYLAHYVICFVVYSFYLFISILIRHASTFTISISKIYYCKPETTERVVSCSSRLLNLVNEQLLILEFKYNCNLHTIISCVVVVVVEAVGAVVVVVGTVVVVVFILFILLFHQHKLNKYSSSSGGGGYVAVFLITIVWQTLQFSVYWLLLWNCSICINKLFFLQGTIVRDILITVLPVRAGTEPARISTTEHWRTCTRISREQMTVTLHSLHIHVNSARQASPW